MQILNLTTSSQSLRGSRTWTPTPIASWSHLIWLISRTAHCYWWRSLCRWACYWSIYLSEVCTVVPFLQIHEALPHWVLSVCSLYCHKLLPVFTGFPLKSQWKPTWPHNFCILRIYRMITTSTLKRSATGTSCTWGLPECFISWMQGNKSKWS
jgi:hypothetical protein